MELQGNKATHDFLSLYTKDSSFPHQDPRPSSQGFFLKTHDFLQPLERGDEKGEKPPTRDVAGKGPPTEHVLPGGIGTFSICHVADVGGGARPEVKPELVTVGKPEPDSGGFARYPTGAPFGIWGESASRESASRGGGHWSLPYGGRGSGATASSASRHNQATERKVYMDAVSMSSRGFDEDENDGEDFTRREASSSLKELTVRTDGKGSGSGSDQRPNTPRSKHSATEQRRRSKINDRFQILRELIPHSDQKRDKASFLLEVIEYIRFLQEKVQKFESSYPPDYQDNPKLMPWANAYFRSFWKNAENKNFNGEGMPDPALFLKNGGVGFPFPTTPIVANPTEPVFTPTSEPVSLSGPSPSPIQTETQAQVQWLRQTLAEDSALSNTNINTNTNIINTAATNNVITINNNNNNNNNSSSGSLVNEREDLAIDEGTISLSTNYSQELLTVLSQALQRSGIDLSEASISVQISLGKRAKKSCTAAGGTSLQEGENENNDRGKGCEENVRPVKRRKADKNNNS